MVLKKKKGEKKGQRRGLSISDYRYLLNEIFAQAPFLKSDHEIKRVIDGRTVACSFMGRVWGC